MELVKGTQKKIVKSTPFAAIAGSVAIFSSNAAVISILNAIGIYDPPTWLVYAILAVSTIGAIVGILTSFGLATVPLWAARALAVAGGVSA